MEINTRMKKYHHYLTLLSLFMLLGILKLQAAIQLPAIFSNHMVLQRNSELTFWGWGIPGETILSSTYKCNFLGADNKQ